MGGLYDAATLRALSSAVLVVVSVVCAAMVVVIVFVIWVVLVRCSSRCCGCGVARLRAPARVWLLQAPARVADHVAMRLF